MRTVLVVVVLVVVAGCSPMEDARERAKVQGQTYGPSLVVEDLKAERSGTKVVVRGRIRNVGTKDVDRLTLLVRFLGPDGRPVHEDRAFVVAEDVGTRLPLRAGQTLTLTEENSWVVGSRVPREWSGRIAVEFDRIGLAN